MKRMDDKLINAACFGKRSYSSQYACEKQGSYHKNNGRNNGKRVGIRRCYRCLICRQWHCGFDMSAPSKKRIKVIGRVEFAEEDEEN